MEHRYRLAGKNAAAALAVVNFLGTSEVARIGAGDRPPRTGSKAVDEGSVVSAADFAEDSSFIGDIKRAIEWRLEDVLEIQRLLMDYGRHLDARDLHSYSLLFCEDGEWTGATGTAVGPAAIQAMLEANLPGNPAAPGATTAQDGRSTVSFSPPE